MLLENRVANALNKQKIAEMANIFVTELSDRLGVEYIEVDFKPELFYYRQKNTMRRLNKMRHEKEEVLRFAANYVYRKVRIEENLPFFDSWVKGWMAYTPLINPGGSSEEMIEAAGKNPDNYRMLYGFGSEVAHLFCHTYLYRDHSIAVGEAFDLLGRLHEISRDAAKLKLSRYLERKFIKKYLRWVRVKLRCFETLLFRGSRALREKLTNTDVMKELVSEYEQDMKINNVVKNLKEEYVQNWHFEGSKLFFAAYDKDLNLGNTFKRLGNLLYESCTSIEALEMLGCKDFRKYRKFFVGTDKKRKIVRI